MMQAIECENVCYRIGDQSIIHRCSLRIALSERIAIVGRSGSGKSTLLHLIAGLTRPTSGDISVLGQHLSGMSESQMLNLRRYDMGFVYQFHHLMPELNALENVSLPLWIQRKPKSDIRQKALHMLEALHLSHRADHYPSTLSGGERQRLAIGRALIHQPRLILLDEPTGSLDPDNARSVQKLLMDLQRSMKTTLIVATHDTQWTQEMDRCIDLQDTL